MIDMNAALEDVYKKVFADSIPINMVHLLVEGRKKAVETLTGQIGYPFLLRKRIQDERFFPSLCADWMRTRVINRWTGELRE